MGVIAAIDLYLLLLQFVDHLFNYNNIAANLYGYTPGNDLPICVCTLRRGMANGAERNIEIEHLNKYFKLVYFMWMCFGVCSGAGF